MTVGGLTARIDRSDPALLRVRLGGRSAGRDANVALKPLFDWTISTAAASASRLVVHFDEVEYVNSSTIAAVVQFIRVAQTSGLPVVLVYDGRQKWQVTTFEAMRLAVRPLESKAGPPVRFEVAS